MEYRTVLTTCTYCGTGCGLLLEVMDGEVVGVLPAKTHPINEGKLCIKGWNAHEFIYADGRLTKPLVRKGDTLEEASWDEALETIANKFAEIKKANGPDSLGCFSSAKCTNEENYLLQKIFRAAIGTNNVDHCARL